MISDVTAVISTLASSRLTRAAASPQLASFGFGDTENLWRRSTAAKDHDGARMPSQRSRRRNFSGFFDPTHNAATEWPAPSQALTILAAMISPRSG
jgi:hypothetical protein